MSILVWDQPKKKLTPAEHKESYGFEDGPTGGYLPNMSDADAKKWKAKLSGHKKGFPQVEIRKSFKNALLLVIVNLGKGYNYKQYEAEPDPNSWRSGETTKGINVHISTNGPVQMTFVQMAELQMAVNEAKLFLEEREQQEKGA